MRKLCFLVLCLVSFGVRATGPDTHAVASAHPLATEAGLEILRAGGNAFDAAVAVTATLAVVEPTGSGLGGGGFWLLHDAQSGENHFIDGRETAPLAASADMYLDERGKVVRTASLFGPLAAGIPGEPAAMVHISQHYGRLPLDKTLAPAIKAAREGFHCDDKLAKAFERHWKRFSPEVIKVFGVDGKPPGTGQRIVQLDLANALERIADKGRDGFYDGNLAAALVEGVRAGGGVWTLKDLWSYRVVEREPARIRFGDMEIVTAPLPSAGGISLRQTLGQLEAHGWHSAEPTLRRHLVIEALRRAYRDRAAYLGDADHFPVPVEKLTSDKYIQHLAAGIDPDKATPSKSLAPASPKDEGEQTTHFSVLDAQGNRVAATLSINLPFGSGYMAPGTGILLNDEMDDFSASLDASNAYGLVGSRANLIAPGKRPLSSMSPSIAERDAGVLILGTPGGSRIITMVLHGLLNWSQGADVEQIVSQARYHHQYLPDVVQLEAGAISEHVQAQLQAMGHTFEPLDRRYGNMQAIHWNKQSGTVSAASDPRGVGRAQVESAQ